MYYPRTIISKLNKYLYRSEVIILLGARQVGKTTILKLLQENLKHENIIYLDLDIETNLEYFYSYEDILAFIKLKGFNPIKDKIFLFLDEFQRIKNSGKILKNLYDHHKNIKVIATGSSNLNILKTLGDSMAGRKLIINIFPLDFYEFLIFKENEELLNYYENFELGERIPEFIIKEFYSLFNEFLIYGAYPGIAIEEDFETKLLKINDILNSYLQKDIKETLQIMDTINFKKVMEIVALNISQLLNINTISKLLKLKYHNVNNFIETAKETFFIYTLRPFFSNRKKEIIKAKKVFFGDTGMRNFLIKNMSLELKLRQDLGQLIENFIFTEIIKNSGLLMDLKFWRTTNKTEIDFILNYNGNIIPIEVKSSSYKKIPKALKIFCEQNNIKNAIIFNYDYSNILKEDKTYYYFVPYIFAGKGIKNIDALI